MTSLALVGMYWLLGNLVVVGTWIAACQLARRPARRRHIRTRRHGLCAL